MIVTSLARAGSPLGSGLFQLHAELVAGDDGLELQAEALATILVGHRIGDRARDLDGLGVALDRDLAVDPELVAVALDRVGLEGQLGMALGVEELRALQMGLEVRVLDLDRCDLGGSPQRAIGDAGVERR